MLLLEFFVIASALLAVGVALRRTRSAEVDSVVLRRELARQDEPLEEQEALAAIGLMGSELCEMIISPLTVLLAQCELAQGCGESTPRLKTIEKQARRIASVVERHRGLAPSRRDDKVVIDPLVLADETLESLAVLAADRGVTIHRLYDDLPEFEGNLALWRKAIRHLVRAGIRAAPKGIGDVTLAVGELDGAVVFCVADDGPGMDEHQRRSALRPFDGGSATLRSTGVSYAISAAIAEAIGAELALDSAPGSGTRASIKVSRPARSGPAGGAPDGNRTHVSSLGSWRSTIELQAQR